MRDRNPVVLVSDEDELFAIGADLLYHLIASVALWYDQIGSGEQLERVPELAAGIARPEHFLRGFLPGFTETVTSL